MVNQGVPTRTVHVGSLPDAEVTGTKAADGNTTQRVHIINLKLGAPELSSHDNNEWIPYDEDLKIKWYSVDGAAYFYVDVSVYDADMIEEEEE